MSEHTGTQHSPERRARHADMLARIDASIAHKAEPDAGPDEAADPAVAGVLAAIEAFDLRVAELIASFPADEEADVRRKLYRDADGMPRTRHRMLRLA